MPRLYHIHKGPIPRTAEYIGRPAKGAPLKWGNPFEIGPDGTRLEVIRKYYLWLVDQPTLVAAMKRELKGKDLVCFCTPKACHGDVILAIANDLPLPDYLLGLPEDTQLSLF